MILALGLTANAPRIVFFSHTTSEASHLFGGVPRFLFTQKGLSLCVLLLPV